MYTWICASRRADLNDIIIVTLQSFYKKFTYKKHQMTRYFDMEGVLKMKLRISWSQ
jgi:hypothetical protein